MLHGGVIAPKLRRTASIDVVFTHIFFQSACVRYAPTVDYKVFTIDELFACFFLAKALVEDGPTRFM